MKIAFSDINGEIVLVDFRGRVERVKGEKMVGGGILNVEDINSDGRMSLFILGKICFVCMMFKVNCCWRNAGKMPS